MNYNFKTISGIPNAKELIDVILSKTQRKTPTEIHPQMKVTRIRKFYMRKVKFCADTIEEKLGEIVDNFPKIESIHPFYADLMNVLYDKDHYKLALGHINKAKSLCENVAKDYVRLLKYADSLYRAKTLKKAALGRMCTILKKLSNSLTYLEEIRKHLGRLPSIDPHTRSIILTGFPNVGKSSFMNHVTRANVDVQPFAFSTKSLFVGHTNYELLPWQVIDTPGLLDRPLEERSIVEMQAVTALAHLNACILFFIDVSGSCEASIEKQLELFRSVQPLFVNKPLGIVLTKTDLRSWDSLSEEERQAITSAAEQHGAFLHCMSNISTEGVMECRNLACEKLKEYRDQHKTKSRVNYTMKLPYVSLRASNPERPPVIPQSVIQEKATGVKLQSGPSVRDLQEANGGAGVFSVAVQEHFVELEQEDWRWDVMPEIMDGKNILDFVDPDILEKLDELEQLEAIEADAHVPLDYDEFKQDHDVKRSIVLRRRAVQRDHSISNHTPRHGRVSKQKLEEGLLAADIDPSAALQHVSKRKRPRDEYEANVDMDLDDDDNSLPSKKLRSKSRELATRRRPGTAKPQQSLKEMKVASRGFDTKILDKMPKHLFAGKRGMGKTDRR